MKKYRIARTTLILSLLVSVGISYAQNTMDDKFPKAVLVQLRSEHNRMEYLVKTRSYKDLEKLKVDAVNVQRAMINDFQDHFTNCPVYYYMDTNAPLIQKKIFDGILLNADLTPAKNLPISNAGSDYLVAYYGYPVVKSIHREVVTDTVTDSLQYRNNERKKRLNIEDVPSSPGPEDPFNMANTTNTSGPDVYMHNAGEPSGIGLVILNSDFLQVNYFYKLGYQSLFLKRRVKNDKYHYSSKHFDMEYFPFAALFSEKLTDRHGIHDLLIYETIKPKIDSLRN